MRRKRISFDNRLKIKCSTISILTIKLKTISANFDYCCGVNYLVYNDQI